MRVVTIADVIRRVSEETATPVALLVGEGRARNIARPRQMGYWLARQATGRSLPVIAKAFNRADHTSIMHGLEVITKLRETDAAVRSLTDKLAEEFTRVMEIAE